MVEPGQHVPRKQVRLVEVWIAGQDEGLDSERPIGIQLGQHLIGITHDGGAAARPCPADAGPEIVLDISLGARRLAQFGLP